MFADHGAHVSMITHGLELCQSAPEQHIQCLFGVGEEQVYAPGEVIVGSGQEAKGVFLVL